MQIVWGLESYRPDAGPSAVAVGAFDGIHLGHRAILGTAVAHARREKLQALACTFDRHPMEVLQPDRAPLPITTLEERLELIGETGIDTTVVIPFTPDVAAVQAKAFLHHLLIGTPPAPGNPGALHPPLAPGAARRAGVPRAPARPPRFRSPVDPG